MQYLRQFQNQCRNGFRDCYKSIGYEVEFHEKSLIFRFGEGIDCENSTPSRELVMKSVRLKSEVLTFDIEINSKVIELQRKIISAQDKVLSNQREQDLLLAKIQELEKEFTRFKDWNIEKESYVLKEIASGVFAYIEKNYDGSFQSASKLCTNCFEQRAKSIFQYESLGELLMCPRCSSMIAGIKYLNVQRVGYISDNVMHHSIIFYKE